MSFSKASSESSPSEAKGLLNGHLKYTDEEQLTQLTTKHTSHSIPLYTSLFINILLITALAFALSSSPTIPPSHLPPTHIFSPADSAIEYETLVFHTGMPNDRTPYTGPSDAVDAAWLSLYNDFGLSLIDADSASQLPNRTAPASFDSSKYLVELDVFHQLHCLNRLRKLLYPEKYPVDLTEAGWLVHGEHCVEGLRQALQCASDTATIFWEWSEEDGRMKGNTATTHTCRNFGKIREWAKEHFVDRDDDFFVHTVGAPVKKGGMKGL